MTSSISPELKAESLQFIRECFQDLPFYDEIVSPKVEEILISLTTFDFIDKRFTQALIDQYFVKDAFDKFEGQGKNIYSHIKIIMGCLAVYVLSHCPDYQNELFTQNNQLLEKYPIFQKENEGEQKLLLNFRNFMKIAIKIISPQKNKK
jgi:hypothetical protein